MFGLAAAYGLIVLAPTYLMADVIGRASVPISHPEYFYGFTSTAVAWQFVFALIASDIRRFRPMMLPAFLEKLAFSVPALIVAAQGRLPAMTLPFAIVDLCLAAVFALCFMSTRRQAPKAGGWGEPA